MLYSEKIQKEVLAGWPTRVAASKGKRAWTAAIAFAGSIGAAQIALGHCTHGNVLIYNLSTIDVYDGGQTPVQHVELNETQKNVNHKGMIRVCAGGMASPLESIWAWPATGVSGLGSTDGCCSRSIGNVNLVSGNYEESATDISLPAPGRRFVVARSYNQIQPSSSDGYQGTNWFHNSQPELKIDGGILYLITSAHGYAQYHFAGCGTPVYQGYNGASGFIHLEAGAGSDPDIYVLYDPTGGTTTFIGEGGGGGGSDTPAKGQLWKSTDAAGNTMYIGHPSSISTAISNGFDANGRILKAYDTTGRRYTYTYISVDSLTRLDSVVVETGTDWHTTPTGVAEIQRVTYTYYDQTDMNTDDDDDGLTGQLKTVTVTTPWNSEVDLEQTTYYRYYTSGTGYAGQLKMVVKPEGVRRYTGDLDDAGDTALKPYSTAFLTYDSGADDPKKVHTAIFNGQCGCGSGGGSPETYTFRYEQMVDYPPSYANDAYYDSDYPRWGTVVQQPDGLWVTQYFDEAGEPLSRMKTDQDPQTSVSTRWVDNVIQDSDGYVIERHTPAANNGYDLDSGLFTSGSTGLAWYPEIITDSVFDGIPTGVRFANGDKDPYTQASSLTYLSSTQYKIYTTSSFSMPTGYSTEVWTMHRPWAASTRVYHTATDDPDASGTYDQTSYDYTFWSTTSGDALNLVPKIITTTLPTVSTAKNGSNTAAMRKVYLRKDGTVAFTQSETGLLTYTLYENGLLVMRIEDVDPSNGDIDSQDDTDFYSDLPGGSGYKNLKTIYEYDEYGRLMSTTLPNGRVMAYYYSRLNDDRLVTLSFPWVESGTTYHGPVNYTVTNLAGKNEFTATLAIPSAGITTAQASWITETSNDLIDALHSTLQGTNRAFVFRPSLAVYDESGSRVAESRAYHTILGTGDWKENSGSPEVVSDIMSYEYDDAGRPYKSITPSGTISQTVYDVIGRPVQRWTGTNATGGTFTDPDGSGSPNNMVLVEAMQYDGGSAGKNSLLTERTAHVDGSTTRVTSYIHDFRNRLIVQNNPGGPEAVYAYDNLNRQTTVSMYQDGTSLTVSTDPTANNSGRRSRSDTAYDERGQVWKTTTHEIAQSGGSAGNSLNTLERHTWYDQDGRVLKTAGGSPTMKYGYDRLRRQTRALTMMTDYHTSSITAYAIAGDLSKGQVFEEDQTYYDDSTGNVLMSVNIKRKYDCSDTAIIGTLDKDSDLSLIDFGSGGINNRGRVHITAMWYDALDRLKTAGVYGNNGVSNFDRDSVSEPTHATSNVLVTTIAYGDAGETYQTRDPEGRITEHQYDKALRQVATIENKTGSYDSDEGYTVRTVYTNGHQTQMWVDLDGDGTQDAGDQVTTYAFGVATTDSPGASNLASNEILRSVTYPDSGVVYFAYNRRGEQLWKQDQTATRFENIYDSAGRRTSQKVTNIHADLDDTVQRVDYGYDDLGRANTFSQYNATTAGTQLDYVGYTYDGWGNLAQIVQDNDAVGSGNPAYTTTYSWGKFTQAGHANTFDGNYVRLNNMTYPDGTNIQYDYYDWSSYNITTITARTGFPLDMMVRTPGAGSHTRIARYRMFGMSELTSEWLWQAGDIAKTIYNSSDVAYINMNTTPHLDRYGRLIKDTTYLDPVNFSADPALYDTELTYDKNSNITSIEDNIFRTTTRGMDGLFTYDQRNRLIEAEYGLLNGSKTAITATTETNSMTYMLDQLGNWDDGTGADDFIQSIDYNLSGSVTTEKRGHNTVNEMTSRAVNGGSAATPLYNARGDLTDDAAIHTFVYDVFGRVVSEEYLIPWAEHRYNALGQRIMHKNLNWAPDIEYQDVYDHRWRVIQTVRLESGVLDTWDHDSNGGTPEVPAFKDRIVYHNAGLYGRGGTSYIDSVAFRDRDGNDEFRNPYSDWRAASDGVLENREYYVQNYHADVVAVLASNGEQLEHFRYTPYGDSLHMAAGDLDLDGDSDANDQAAIYDIFDLSLPYDVRADLDLDEDVDIDDYNLWGQSAFYMLVPGLPGETVCRFGYAGYLRDEWWGFLYHVRHRVYIPRLGRWTRQDPIGYVDGMNLYQYARSSPLKFTDAAGLCSKGGCASLATGVSQSQPFEGRPPIVDSSCKIDPTSACMKSALYRSAYSRYYLDCGGANGRRVTIKCGEPLPGLLGQYDCNKHTITIRGDGSDWSDYNCNLLAHELLHAADACNYDPSVHCPHEIGPDEKCAWSLCTEGRANSRVSCCDPAFRQGRTWRQCVDDQKEKYAEFFKSECFIYTKDELKQMFEKCVPISEEYACNRDVLIPPYRYSDPVDTCD